MILADFPSWFSTVLAVCVGLAFGSFLNVVIYRWPRELSVSHPPSSCPGCGKRIRAYDNVPVVSWLLLRGRARCCGTAISVRYPLVELAGGLAAWAVLEIVVLELPATTPWWIALLSFAAHLALVLGLIAAVFIDIEFMLLPDEITIGGTVLGIATVPLREITWGDSLVGAATGFLIVWIFFYELYRRLRGQPGMGLGDAKLLMLSGAWFGWAGALFTLLAGAVQGTVVALVLYAVQGRIEEPEAVRREREIFRQQLEEMNAEERRRAEEEAALDPLSAEPESGLGRARLAFGPFLAVATIEYLFFGETLTDWYLGFLLGY